MNNNVIVIALASLGAVLVLAFVMIVLFYAGDQGLAVAGLVAVAGLIIPQILTLKTTTDSLHKIEQVTEVKLDVLKQVSSAIVDNTIVTESTHDAVNGRMTELIETVRLLSVAQRSLVAEQDERRGVVRKKAQAVAAIESIPPKPGSG